MPAFLPSFDGLPAKGSLKRHASNLPRFLSIRTCQMGGPLCICPPAFASFRADEVTGGFRGLRFVRAFSASSGAICSSNAEQATGICCSQARKRCSASSTACSSSSGLSSAPCSSSTPSKRSSNSSSNSSSNNNSSSSSSSSNSGSSINNNSSSSRSCDSVYRGFRFDRMLDTLQPDPVSVAALDCLSLCTLKTVVLPAAVLQKLQLLLKHVGRKKDIEKAGRLLADKTTARTSVELPRVLPSQLLPEAQETLAAAAAAKEALQQQQQQQQQQERPSQAAARLHREPTASELYLKGRDTNVLRSLPGATEAILSHLPPDGLEAQEALAAAEDARHPLYRHLTTGHSPLTAAAWTAHRFAGVYASMLRILTEVKTRCPHFFPKRILEMNAGFAAGLLAVDAVYGQQVEENAAAAIPRKQGTSSAAVKTTAAAAAAAAAASTGSSIELLMAVEPSVHLASIGRYLTADLSPSVAWQLALYDEGLRRVTHRKTAETTETAETAKAAETAEALDDRFDLVLLPHSLLRSVDGQGSRHSLIRTLWNRMKPGGLLVLLERGTVSGFRVLASVRELFICELGTERFHFVSPCPHESVCPLSLTGRDWCHFGQRVRRLSHHLYCKGSRAKSIEEEKFSFLVVGKGHGPRQRFGSQTAAEAAGAPAETLSFFWPRLVAPPIKGKEHVLLDVCAAPHRFERVAVSKHMPHAAGYKAARHAAWGDLWRHPKRIIRPDARAYMQQELREAAERRHERKVKLNQKTHVGQETERDELDETLIRHFGA